MEWVNSRLEIKGASLVNITSEKPWPFAPGPDTRVVLGLAKVPASETEVKYGRPFDYFPFVLLVQSDAAGTTPTALGLNLMKDVYVSGPETFKENPPIDVDVGPFRITENEYAFGVTVITGEVARLGGSLYEMMDLYRYHDNELKEIYRDVVWAYYKLSGPNPESCNVDMEILTQPSTEGEFYTITRQYKRSYLGDGINAEFRGVQNTRATPVESCRATVDFKAPYTQKWNTEKKMYLDHRGLFLSIDELRVLNIPPVPLRSASSR
jgi:hypothetical protein